MAAAPGRLSRTRSITGMLIVTVVMACLWPAPAGAESPADAWNRLMDAAREAYHAGRYGEGVRFAEEALEIVRTTLGERDERTLTTLNDLALLYQGQGRYGEAEPLLVQVLERRREVLGADHLHTLTGLNNLAALYRVQGRYGEAEPLFEQVLEESRENLLLLCHKGLPILGA